MKLLRVCVVACVVGLALSAVGCGGETPTASVESKDSALTSSQIWQGGPSLFEGYAYSCGGTTWYLRQYVTQALGNIFANPPTQPSTKLMDDTSVNGFGYASLNYDIAEVQVRCPATTFASNSSFAWSTQTKTCEVYAHPAHVFWQWSEEVTISSGNLRYAPIGTPGYPNGYWDIQMTLANDYNKIGTGYGLGCFGFGGTAEIYAF